jgi:hypothetical protein
MDKRISVHFFHVVPRNAGVPPLGDVLRAADRLGADPGARQRNISDDVVVRLEALGENGNWLEGDFTRIQSDNIPPEAEHAGLVPSRAQNQGHCAAFIYQQDTGLLVVQRNANGMTISRMFRYLYAVDPTARYNALPIASRDMWDRFAEGRAKKFSVTLAPIDDPAQIEGPVDTVVGSSRRLAEALEGVKVHISVSAGSDAAGLNKGVIRTVIEALTGGGGAGADVTTLSVTSENEADDASEVINFLGDVLKDKEEVDLNGLDGRCSLEVRIAALRACYARQMDHIMRHYG